MKTIAETVALLQEEGLQIGSFILNPNKSRRFNHGMIGTLKEVDITTIQCSDGLLFCEDSPFSQELKN